MLKKISPFFFLFATCFLYLVSYSYALELNSPRFKIEVDKLDIDAKKTKQNAVYTVGTVYGPKSLAEFESQGYTLASQNSNSPLVFSLSQSLIHFSDLTADQPGAEVTFSASTPENQDLKVSLIQEYPLKNFSGDTISLNYSLPGQDVFRSLPNQNKGEFPALIIKEKANNSTKLTFRLQSGQNITEGTYETIVNFIITPEN